MKQSEQIVFQLSQVFVGIEKEKPFQVAKSLKGKEGGSYTEERDKWLGWAGINKGFLIRPKNTENPSAGLRQFCLDAWLTLAGRFVSSRSNAGVAQARAETR